MPGPITEARIECSQRTVKEGSSPVLVRLSDNAVLDVNKRKLVKKQVGQFVKATGDANDKAGRIKLQAAEPIERGNIPKGEPGSELLDVRNFRTDERLYNEVRRRLARMPYISQFDFISFTMMGNNVILTGWTVRRSNRSTAYNRVKNIESVGNITNNIEVLPMGRADMAVRANARARLQRHLSRYFWGSGSAIKIVVNRGNIILLGTVDRQADADMAYLHCSGVPGSFHVFNMLRVRSS
jgi:osmotically-inducible protein OsmY